MPGEYPVKPERRHDLDWIRVTAFGALILYHLSLVYTHIPWTSDAEGQPGMALFHAALSPWRMGLLFTLSGMALSFMTERRDPDALWRERSRRLLLPLAFGVVFLTPPYTYCVLVVKLGYHESFFTYLLRYFSPSHSVTLGKVTYGLPLVMHLWYLAYLTFYTLMLTTLLKRAPDTMRRLGAVVGRHAAGPGLIAWPLALLMLMRTLIYPLANPGNIVEELYRHLAFFCLFLFGFLVGRREAVWDALVRYRWIALAMAAAGFAVFGYYTLLEGRGDGGLAEAHHPVLHLVRPVEVWGAICAVFGFGHIYLRRGGPVLSYLSRGILTFYVLHQPVIMITAALLHGFHLPEALEAAIVLAVTAAACLAGYEVVRRLGPVLVALAPRRATTAHLAEAA